MKTGRVFGGDTALSKVFLNTACRGTESPTAVPQASDDCTLCHTRNMRVSGVCRERVQGCSEIIVAFHPGESITLINS